MNLHLDGKIALVTGASQGLGYAVALALSREGARVALNSRNLDKLQKSAEAIESQTGNEVKPFAMDVADPRAADTLIDQVVNAFGGLDLLLANAGGPPAGSFETFTDDDWQHAVDLCFLSQVRLIRAALPHLRKSEIASVLTVTSMSVKQPITNLVLSNSVRLATVGLTKSLALELGNQGIRFNSILPGWTETDRVVSLMKHRAQSSGLSIEEETRKQAKDIPLGRMATPDEFANSAVFLLSPAASYLTGVMLSVDGGMYKGTF
ncbi:SDR family oxidoreductase [bacterium]|nr:MAG: SDR family oxidoreductase [bacterium]